MSDELRAAIARIVTAENHTKFLEAVIERMQAAYQGDIVAMTAEIEELCGEIERLRAALALSQSQNYCTLCGALNPDKNSRALKVKL